MLAGLHSSVWYSSRQLTTCVGVGVRGCVRQTQTALNIMTLLTHAHSMCASAQLVFLLLGLLVQTYVVRVAHAHCGCDTVQHIETSPARSQATTPGKKHRHNTVNITDTTTAIACRWHVQRRPQTQHTSLVQNDKSCLEQLMNFIQSFKHFIQIPLRNKPTPHLGEER